MKHKISNFTSIKNNIQCVKIPIVRNVNNNNKNDLDNISFHKLSKNVHEINIDRSIPNNTSIINVYKNNTSTIQSINNSISLKKLERENHPDHHMIRYLSKNINKSEHNIQKIFLVKYSEKENNVNSMLYPYLRNDLKKIQEWKKAISQQTLFFIFQKENIAEIQVGPKNLRPIYIKIHMKNDQATVNFISNHLLMQHFLYNAIPFLKDSLVKNGVKINKIHVHSVISQNNRDITIIDQKNNNNNDTSHIEDLEKFVYFHKKNIQHRNIRGIDIYI